jgi:methylmalonyl-CoA mutase
MQHRPSAFSTTSLEQWRTQVEKDLKGVALDAITIRSRDGFELPPLLQPAPPSALAAAAHGAIAEAFATHGPWTTAALVSSDDPASLAALVATAASREAQLVWLDTSLRDIDLAHALVDLQPLPRIALLRSTSGNTSELAPIAHRVKATSNPFPAQLRAQASAEATAAAVEAALQSPGALLADATFSAEAGHSEATELAIALTAALRWLQAADARNMALEPVAARIELLLSTGRDLFFTVAKFRAARLLISSLFDQAGVTAVPRIHALETLASKTTLAPWTNLIRLSIETSAAIFGGAQSIALRGHDAASGTASTESLRLALNAACILREESHLGVVADPAQGSASLEQLTEQLATAAWALFQAEQRGAKDGSGLVAKGDVESAPKFAASVTRRRESIIGVTEFPDLGERAVAPAAAPTGPAAPRRWSQPVEAARAAVEAAGERPTVALYIGDTSDKLKPRIAFAKGLFATLGFKAIELPLGSAAATAAVACLCTSDALLAEQTPAFIEAAKSAGASHLFAAGNPGDAAASLQAAGITDFLNLATGLAPLLQRAAQLTSETK